MSTSCGVYGLPVSGLVTPISPRRNTGSSFAASSSMSSSSSFSESSSSSFSASASLSSSYDSSYGYGIGLSSSSSVSVSSSYSSSFSSSSSEMSSSGFVSEGSSSISSGYSSSSSFSESSSSSFSSSSSSSSSSSDGSSGGSSSSSSDGGSSSASSTSTSSSTTVSMKKIMEKCVKDAIDGGSGGSGGSGGGNEGNAKENFKHYFENRMDNIGPVNWDFTTDNIKGRKSAVCSSGVTAASCDTITQMMPSPNLAANVIMIKNKSYFDFDLTVDVLFRQATKAGIAFKMRDQYNYYAFMIDVPSRSKQLIKVTDGRVQVLRKIEDGGVILNDWHSIHITTTYSNMKIFIYDAETIDRKSTEKIIEYYDNSFVEGQIGIIVGNAEGFCYDKLKVTGKVVWTPWVPRKEIKIIQKTSGVFNEGK